jgi:hypothetical protein
MISIAAGGRMKAEVLREIAALRQNEFFKTLSMLRAQFNLMVMEAATQNRKSVILEIPQSYVGREPYDPVEMGKALVEQFKEDGYTVNGTYLRFTVSWATSTSSGPATAKEDPSPRPLIRVPKAKRV